MTAAAVEIELLELPAAFQSLPFAAQLRAQNTAQSMLPVAKILAVVGQAQLEVALINGAAHILSTTGDARPPMYFDGDQPASVGADDPWCGSPYGDVVRGILSKLARPSGRTRSLGFST